MRLFLFLLLLTTGVAHADCGSYVIGFRGASGAFDQAAFDRYAERNADCSVVYNSDEITDAVEFINQTREPYQLYGYSAGASAIKPILRKVRRMPGFILTVGAWYLTDVNFDRYDIDFDNFFDESGRQQKSPGMHVPNVPHDRMQEYVTQFYE
jgi:hypothetical protein